MSKQYLNFVQKLFKYFIFLLFVSNLHASKVVDIQEGTGKHQGKLGAFHVEGKDDGKFFSLSVGSGLTDEQRDNYWESKDELIGRLIEVRADAVTQNIDGEHYSLRFPRFKSFRGFEKDEKI